MDGSAFYSSGRGAMLPHGPAVATGHAPMRARRGIVAGTMIATSTGWRAVEHLVPGDEVQTFDNGMQMIVEITAEDIWHEDSVALNDPLPILMPAGALRNKAPVTVLPHQGVLVESENACDAMGDPLAVVPARVLIGVNGIDTSPPDGALTVFSLTFMSDEIIYADGGLLLHCPSEAETGEMMEAERLYDVKSLVEARQMLTELDIAQLILDEEGFDLYEADALERVA